MPENEPKDDSADNQSSYSENCRQWDEQSQPQPFLSALSRLALQELEIANIGQI